MWTQGQLQLDSGWRQAAAGLTRGRCVSVVGVAAVVAIGSCGNNGRYGSWQRVAGDKAADCESDWRD